MTSTEIKSMIIKELENRGVTDKYVKVDPICGLKRQRIQICENVYSIVIEPGLYIIYDEYGLYALSIGVDLEYVIKYFLEGEDFEHVNEE